MTATETRRILIHGATFGGWVAKPCPPWCQNTDIHAQGEWPVHVGLVGSLDLSELEWIEVFLISTDRDGVSVGTRLSSSDAPTMGCDRMRVPVSQAGALAFLLEITSGNEELAGLVRKAIDIHEGSAS